MRTWISSIAALGISALVGSTASAQNQQPQAPGQPQVPGQQPQVQGQPQVQNANKTMRARVTKVEGTDRIMVRTNDNRDAVLFVNPQTKIIINGRQARIADLTNDADINVTYTMDGERYLVNQVQIGAVGTAAAPNENDRRFRGRVSKIVNKEQFVVKSQVGKEVTFYTQPQAQIMIDGKSGRVEDLKVGSEVEVVYTERNDQWWVESVTVTPATTNNTTAPAANEVHGTILRIVGNDQVVVKTVDGKEVTVFVVPTTTYSLDNQPGRLVDLQPGTTVRVQTETRERGLFGRSFLGLRRTNR